MAPIFLSSGEVSTTKVKLHDVTEFCCIQGVYDVWVHVWACG